MLCSLLQLRHGLTARRALKENRSVADIVLEERLLTEDQLNQLLELEAMTRPARRQPVPKLKDS